MEDLIKITYDDNEPDYPAIACWKDGKNINLKVAYIGNEAKELYRIVTEQGYLKELLNRK